jgi:protein-tyrosine phosphatase
MPNPRERMTKHQIPEPIKGFANFGHLNLSSVNNARDLGGMPAGHKFIDRRRILRSGSLSDATQEDLNLLMDSRDVDLIIDLRSDVEIEREPDPKHLMRGVGYIHASVIDADTMGISGKTTANLKGLTSYLDKPYEQISEIYIEAVLGRTGKRAFARVFEELLYAKNGATLFHCAQGKDRTGICAWLIEAALGVSEQDRYKDYLATNIFIEGMPNKFTRIAHGASLNGPLSNASEAYGFAHVEYYNSFTSAITENYGTVEAYLERALGVDKNAREQLQAMYLI